LKERIRGECLVATAIGSFLLSHLISSQQPTLSFSLSSSSFSALSLFAFGSYIATKQRRKRKKKKEDPKMLLATRIAYLFLFVSMVSIFFGILLPWGSYAVEAQSECGPYHEYTLYPAGYVFSLEVSVNDTLHTWYPEFGFLPEVEEYLDNFEKADLSLIASQWAKKFKDIISMMEDATRVAFVFCSISSCLLFVSVNLYTLFLYGSGGETARKYVAFALLFCCVSVFLVLISLVAFAAKFPSRSDLKELGRLEIEANKVPGSVCDYKVYSGFGKGFYYQIVNLIILIIVSILSGFAFWKEETS
jgi:hypothetical protein